LFESIPSSSRNLIKITYPYQQLPTPVSCLVFKERLLRQKRGAHYTDDPQPVKLFISYLPPVEPLGAMPHQQEGRIIQTKKTRSSNCCKFILRTAFIA
jgi:hypothetical protein